MGRPRRSVWAVLFLVALGVVALVAAGAKGMLSAYLAPLAPALKALSVAAAETPDAGGTDAGAAADAFVPRKQAAPLSSAQLGAPLVRGSFVTACNAPSTMKVVAKVTVQKGKATGVNVATDPPDTAVSRCIDDAIHELRWDISPKAQELTVHY